MIDETSDEAPRVRIRTPQNDAVLDVAAAGDVLADIDAGQWLALDERRRIAVVLDDYRVRYVGRASKSYRIRDLVTAGTDLPRGEHRLTAIAVGVRGTLLKPTMGKVPPYASIRFWAGGRTGPPQTTAQLIYVEPQGTYNGPIAAAEARLDYYVTGADAAPIDSTKAVYPVEVTIKWPGGSFQQRLSQWKAWRLSNLVSGDYEVELRFGAQSATRAVKEAFSVNLDAPVREARAASAEKGTSNAPPPVSH